MSVALQIVLGCLFGAVTLLLWWISVILGLEALKPLWKGERMVPIVGAVVAALIGAAAMMAGLVLTGVLR